ncbi:hypothetical protein JOF41_006459 [Saccharothrix coeruleofusca]|uniref:hypothetical protein n=1 Tax=Saccharothrix coeruleofusca TaxID=33919 RepID=UPI001AE785C9|nr:hypothetical protein [Saccharothrix coeruleofusca]MBP2340281.1 hypothetical protein [Saccharothrix coeruleofusca]
MGKPVAHIGTRSWWSGQVKTLCGQTMPEGGNSRVWFPTLSGYTVCPTCRATDIAAKR